MGVYKNTSLSTETPARAMSEDAMQKDFEFRISEKLTLSPSRAHSSATSFSSLFRSRPLSAIRALNREKFYPFYAELY